MHEIIDFFRTSYGEYTMVAQQRQRAPRIEKLLLSVHRAHSAEVSILQGQLQSEPAVTVRQVAAGDLLQLLNPVRQCVAV